MSEFAVALTSLLAQAGDPKPQAPGSTFDFLVPMVVVFIVIMVLSARTQKREQDEKQSLLDALKKGDEVITTGGILGKVAAVHDSKTPAEVELSVDSSGKTKIRILKSSIAQKVTKSEDASSETKKS